MRCSFRMRCTLRTGCGFRARRRLLTGSRLRMGRGSRTRSRLRMRCSRLTGLSGRTSLLRLRCFIRGSLVFVRPSRSCLILGSLVLVRPSRRCLIRGSLILIRPSRNCFILGSLILVRASRRLVRGSLILVRPSRRCPIRGSLILIRASRRCLIPGRLVLDSLVLSSFVRCTRLPGCHYSVTAKLAGLGRCSDCRTPPVHRRQERVVGTGSVHMLGLHRGWRGVLLASRTLFRGGRPGADSTPASVVADMVYRRGIDYGFAVNIVNIRDVHIVHRAVVVEGSVIPISASVADTTVAEAVVDATVEADLRTPIAFIPGEGAAPPTPVTRSPEQTSFRSHRPCARHPEVAFIPIGPVPGRPHVSDGGAHGLGVHRKRGRSDHDRHSELREQTGRYGQYHNC